MTYHSYYTLKEFVGYILGSYVPYQSNELIGTLDIPYIFGGIIFILSLWFIYRLLLTFFGKK